MSLKNQLHNARNPAQGTFKRVLCLCSAGLLRSPTTAWVLSQDPWNYNTRSAGVMHDWALVGVDHALIYWANEIVCAQPRHENVLRDYCEHEGISLEQVPIVTLNIPDVYEYRDPELVRIIKEQYAEASETPPVSRAS